VNGLNCSIGRSASRSDSCAFRSQFDEPGADWRFRRSACAGHCATPAGQRSESGPFSPYGKRCRRVSIEATSIHLSLDGRAKLAQFPTIFKTGLDRYCLLLAKIILKFLPWNIDKSLKCGMAIYTIA